MEEKTCQMSPDHQRQQPQPQNLAKSPIMHIRQNQKTQISS